MGPFRLTRPQVGIASEAAVVAVRTVGQELAANVTAIGRFISSLVAFVGLAISRVPRPAVVRIAVVLPASAPSVACPRMVPCSVRGSVVFMAGSFLVAPGLVVVVVSVGAVVRSAVEVVRGVSSNPIC